MTGVGAGPDEVVVRKLKRRGKIGKPTRLLRHELRHRQTGGHGNVDILERVVVRAAQEPNRVSAFPPMAREHVGLHEFQRVPEMRVAVHVRDRGRDVEASRVAHRFLPS